MDLNVNMFFTSAIWICITIGVWIVGKLLAKSLYCGKPTDEGYTDKLEETNKVFSIMAKILVAVWIAGLLILFGLGGTKVHDKGADMGSTQTAIEAEQYVPPTIDEIDTSNEVMLNRDDEIREKEVAADQKKSRDEFNDFLNSVE